MEIWPSPLYNWNVDKITIFVLTEIEYRPSGLTRTNVDVTTHIAEAELHAARQPIPTEHGYKEFDVDKFSLPVEAFVEGADTTMLLKATRELRSALKPLQAKLGAHFRGGL